MATLEFRGAIGKVFFDGGLTEDGKLIRKAKSYRNIAQGVNAANLYNALSQLAQFSERAVVGMEKVETSEVVN
ncbi:DUF1659 domain-containing protein [Sporosarcina cyprini]|uniref:DUF1659 domain-containing protein n=1 Tax=Sporosarcina cyprini TaxID=2910523 RepID=UPI001EE05B02|nr:DUF1659 domain-containing protein [Sporosarcina cyprini]MCG3088732.1 DUF1659 domain-containing protein [Sporosarcina cyprini]